ncbi:phage holin family protein [Flavihumibacter fluvii]|uniref:phage holin family protein n=1 Tax=Flavihumibacter fluvii TaxID=2838157 RepID=UPI001BDDF0A6|nr:phage holin family protein [Flavihumibacter fluvii]ULQ51872.1 phage holin family protein [Flavihumibacter fluvii]
MDDLRDTAEEVIDHSGDLLETYYRLLLVNATEKGSAVISVGISAVLVGFLAAMAILLAGVGMAWWIGEVLQNMKAGFFIMGGVFILMFSLFLALSKRTIYPFIRNTIIRKLYE